MNRMDGVILDFDESKRILIVSAEEKITLETKEALNMMCKVVSSLLGKYTSDDLCYMAMDISKIAIEPSLVAYYSEKVEFLCKNYLHPGGLVRFGFEITRVTAQMGHDKYLHTDPHLFRNRHEALEYLDKLISQNKTADKSA
jgi:hypothetical protein